MRQRFAACVTCLILSVFVAMASASVSAQAGGDAFSSMMKFLGIWTGSWDGAGTGGFELTLEKNKEGAPAGRVSVTGEPTYKATLKKVTFDGTKMSAIYDFPPDDRVEILLSATFDGNTAKGTWTARSKDNGGEVMAGGWTVKKQ